MVSSRSARGGKAKLISVHVWIQPEAVRRGVVAAIFGTACNLLAHSSVDMGVLHSAGLQRLHACTAEHE